MSGEIIVSILTHLVIGYVKFFLIIYCIFLIWRYFKVRKTTDDKSKRRIRLTIFISFLLWSILTYTTTEKGVKIQNVYDVDGLTWDGKCIWTCSPFKIQKYKIGRWNLLELQKYQIVFSEHDAEAIKGTGSGIWAEGIAWDGNNLWICDSRYSREIYKLNDKPEEVERDGLKRGKEGLTKGKVLVHYIRVIERYKSPGPHPSGLTWDGNNLWSCDLETDMIYKHNMDSILSVQESYKSPGDMPGGLAYDGTNIWSLNIYLYVKGGGPGIVGDTIITKTGVKIYKHNMDENLSVAEEHKVKYAHGLCWDGEQILSTSGDRLLKFKF